MAYITLLRFFIRKLTQFVKSIGKSDFPCLVVNPYPFKYPFLPDIQNRAGQILPVVSEHAVVSGPFDDIADLDCIVDRIFPEKSGQEIDVDIDNDPERKNQQNNQQNKELYTD